MLLVGALAAVVILLLNGRSRQRARRVWDEKARSTLDSAHLVLGLLPTSGGDSSSAAHWDAVRTRVIDAASSFERVAAKAPTSETRRTAGSCADALRNSAFALDADRLLREGGRSPTASELANADVAIRQGSAAVDGALEALGALVGSPQRSEAV